MTDHDKALSAPPAALAGDAIEAARVAYRQARARPARHMDDDGMAEAIAAYIAAVRPPAAIEALQARVATQAGELEWWSRLHSKDVARVVQLEAALREVKNRAAGERYDGTPYEPDDATTEAEKELVGMLNHIEAIADAALSQRTEPKEKGDE